MKYRDSGLCVFSAVDFRERARTMRILIRLLQVLLVLWLVRLAWRTLAGWLGASGDPSAGSHSRSRYSVRSPSGMPHRELMKDPQCGTYVSPEVSIQARFRGEELHFCSRECQEQFFRTQAEQPDNPA